MKVTFELRGDVWFAYIDGITPEHGPYESGSEAAIQFFKAIGTPCDECKVKVGFVTIHQGDDSDKELTGCCVCCGGKCKPDYDGALCSRCAGESGS